MFARRIVVLLASVVAMASATQTPVVADPCMDKITVAMIACAGGVAARAPACREKAQREAGCTPDNAGSAAKNPAGQASNPVNNPTTPPAPKPVPNVATPAPPPAPVPPPQPQPKLEAALSLDQLYKAYEGLCDEFGGELVVGGGVLSCATFTTEPEQARKNIRYMVADACGATKRMCTGPRRATMLDISKRLQCQGGPEYCR